MRDGIESEKEMSLVKNQSTAIGKKGTEVTLYCYDENDANEMFEWLLNVGDESKLQFVGEISGDGECFYWKTSENLYPEEVMRRLGCEPDKKYKFTISCEEV